MRSAPGVLYRLFAAAEFVGFGLLILVLPIQSFLSAAQVVFGVAKPLLAILIGFGPFPLRFGILSLILGSLPCQPLGLLAPAPFIQG